MKKFTASVITTRNGNYFCSMNEENLFFYMEKTGKVLRISCPEENWNNSRRWGGKQKPTSLEISSKTIRFVQARIKFLKNYSFGELSETCYEVGAAYRIVQPNGDVEIIAYATGCVWHGYEGAIGYDRYDLNKLISIERNGKIIEGGNKSGRRRASRK